MKKVGILYHPLKEAASALAKELEGFLESRNISTWLCSAWDAEKARDQVNNTDLILTVGGDGTILRAAQVVLPSQIPITGINLGKLGFLTELSVEEAKSKLPALLAGEGWVDERALLEAELLPAGQGPAPTLYALNDVVVARGAVARLLHIEAYIDDEHLSTYNADGVIIASATGSTGYSMAVGGPILHPQAGEYVLVSIAPHLSLSYPLVLPCTSVVKLHLGTPLQATLSIDGHINLPVSGEATVLVRNSSHTVRFLRTYPRASFYGSLEQRLKGKQ